MSSAKGYEHDVFISYATVDDRPRNNGWVTAFVSTLRDSLAAMFGRSDPDRIWWDRTNIDEEASLTEQIRTKVERSACMVVILSRGYLASKWCREECSAFLKRAKQQSESPGRLFLVDIGNLTESERPEEFHDIRGRHFWVQPPGTDDPQKRRTLGAPVPDPNVDREFYAQIDDLAKSISARVQRVTPSSAVNHEVSVFVAESSDTAQDQRDQVARFLSDHFRVLPALDEPLPGRWDQWNQTVTSALAASSVFVQILDQFPGRKLTGSDQKLVAAQWDLAQAAGFGLEKTSAKRILQWRHDDVVPASATDERMRQLLTEAEFRGPLGVFMAEVKRLASPPASPKPVDRPIVDSGQMPMIFINAGAEDRPQAQALADALAGMDCFSPLPLTDGDPRALREDFEANVLECDGLILFYGRIPPQWVRQQLMLLRRLLPQREKLDPPRPLRAVAICKGPPSEKPDVSLSWPGLKWIDSSTGVQPQQLRDWLLSLRTGGAV